MQREDFERDLVLVARIEGATPVYSWWPLSITVEIVNRSPSKSYPIVMPGDGSDANWREPHVYFTIEIQAQDGTWSLVLPRGVGRCGNYDPYWLDEIVQLAPGASQRLQWMREPTLPDHGRVRVRAHYVYAARPPGPRWGEDDRSQPLGLGGMAGVEPFALVSAPLEFVLQTPDTTRAEIERDLAIELVRDGAGPANSWELQRFHVRLTNKSVTRSHLVVRPSFVKKDERHEPRISEVVRVELGDGRWQEANNIMGGFYDGPVDDRYLRPDRLDWRTQVIELRPEQAIDFELPGSFAQHEFHEASAAAMVVEYAYDARTMCDAKGTPAAPPAALGAMAAIPPFRLRSNEVTWPVHSPLHLEIVPRADRDLLRATNLRDYLRIVLRNEGEEPIEISSKESVAKLGVSAQGLLFGKDAVDVSASLAIGPLVIPARGEISLLEDPAVEVGRLSTSPVDPRSPKWLEPGRVEALLHRPGWIHSFSSVQKLTTK